MTDSRISGLYLKPCLPLLYLYSSNIFISTIVCIKMWPDKCLTLRMYFIWRENNSQFDDNMKLSWEKIKYVFCRYQNSSLCKYMFKKIVWYFYDEIILIKEDIKMHYHCHAMVSDASFLHYFNWIFFPTLSSMIRGKPPIITLENWWIKSCLFLHYFF